MCMYPTYSLKIQQKSIFFKIKTLILKGQYATIYEENFPRGMK